MPVPLPPRMYGGPDDHRAARSRSTTVERLVERVGDARRRHVEADLGHGHLELLAVLGGGDGLGVGADQLDAVRGRARPASTQLHGQVERGLAAERRQQGVGPLRSMIAVSDVDVERLDVGGVGELGVGHDRRRVRVGEDDPVALLAQHAAGLRARVVELARLADDDRPGADEQDRLEVVAAGHQRSARGVVHRASVERRRTGSAASCGPGPASGWYCTLKARHVAARGGPRRRRR